MATHGYGVIEMAYSYSRVFHGVCGNIRFKMFSVTDSATTNSVLKTEMVNRIILATNTSDNADHFRARSLSWTGTADTDVTNELKDTTQTFVAQLTGSMVDNVTDGAFAKIGYKDADELYTYKPNGSAALDLFNTGNEEYAIKDERKLMITPVTADDDGTIIVMGW